MRANAIETSSLREKSRFRFCKRRLVPLKILNWRMFSLEEQRNADSSMDAFNSWPRFPTEGKFVQARQLGTVVVYTTLYEIGALR